MLCFSSLCCGDGMEGEKPNVLLVDDLEANRVALDALLGDLDCQLVHAQSGEEALRQLLRREFALLLLDVQMPGMDGYELAKYARDNASTRQVPIVFLTAMGASEASMLRGYGAGAIDYLFKPINPEVLRAKVSVFLELYLSRRALAQEVVAHKRTMDELSLSNTALRHFTDAASHDLRAPLRAIRAFLEALAEEASERLDGQARDYLDRSRRAAQRMDSLLGSLLTHARLRQRTERTRVDFNEVVEHVCTDLSERIREAGAEIRIAPLPCLDSDPDRIYQLFLNLLSNAIKFQRPGHPPRVTVSAERRGRFWAVCVEDEGIGVAAEYRASIFGAFERLHEPSKYEGNGLGLTICQEIVGQYGGHIWMEPGREHGSRFWFDLPVSGA